MTQPTGVVDATFAGTDPHAVYALQLSEFGPPHVSALAELPAVGPHATGLGKVAASSSLPMELRTYGWQLQRGNRISSADQRRARTHRDSIIQAFVDVTQGAHIPEVSVRLPGPVTTVIEAMLPSGQRIVRDHGARQDVAGAWAEAVAELTSRIHDVIGAQTTIFVQEPQAQRAVDGKIRSVSGADVERALDISEVRSMWQLAAHTDATLLIDTTAGLASTAAEVGSVAMELPVGRTQRTEETWELVDSLVSAETPVGLYLPHNTTPELFAEDFIQQYLDWGLTPAGLEHVRLTLQLVSGAEREVGTGLEWLRTVAEHAAGYLATL